MSNEQFILLFTSHVSPFTPALGPLTSHDLRLETTSFRLPAICC